MRRLRRNQKGNQITEFGPAVFVLIICVFIPMMVLIYVGFGFCCGWYLNYMTVRACAVVKRADLANAISSQQTAWYGSGLPRFAGATVIRNNGPANDLPSIRVNTDTDTPVEFDDYCRVITVVRIQPWITIPFVPINSWDFTYFGERPIEEPDVES